MFGRAFRELDYRLAVSVLVIIPIGTIAAGILGGLNIAALVGLLLFILLDGLNCVWTVLTRRRSEKTQRESDAAEQTRFHERTENNPTLR